MFISESRHLISKFIIIESTLQNWNEDMHTYGKAAIVASFTKISRRTVREMLYGCGGMSLYLLQKLAGCSKYSCLHSLISLLFAITKTGILLSAKYFWNKKVVLILPKYITEVRCSSSPTSVWSKYVYRHSNRRNLHFHAERLRFTHYVYPCNVFEGFGIASVVN